MSESPTPDSTRPDGEGALRIIESFVDLLGHELRNPLSAILTAAQLLERRADSEKIARPVSRIVVSAEQMERMIAQLLDFTRVRLGRGMLLERAPTDLAELVDALEQPAVRISSTGDATGTWDRDRLQRVLTTLVSNACQHGTPPVVLVIDGHDPHAVTLEVKNGGTIPEERLATLFDPVPEKRANASGLGLGLYLARQIVLAHGGTIIVRSSELHGTSVLVQLPRGS